MERLQIESLAVIGAGAYLADPSPLDRDNDGFEDVELDMSMGPYDDCPDEPGDSFRDRCGCVDTDGDGWSDSFDDMPENSDQYADSDGDGYGDAPGFPDSDDCPTLGPLRLTQLVAPTMMVMAFLTMGMNVLRIMPIR